MAETIVAFQSHLSGVMETVFKAAMFEITRLVEDSFLEEITRCKEQVDTLKKRLKLSESRRKLKETDNHQLCANCGGVGLSLEKARTAAVQTDTNVKHENVMPEDVHSPQTTDGETQDVKTSPKASQSPCVYSKNLNRGKKSSNLQVLPNSDEKRNSSDEESNVPGSSNNLSNPKYQLTWEAGFDQKPESEQNGDTDNLTEPLYQNRYDMDEFDDFNRTCYGDTNMIGICKTDDDLIYMGQYEDTVRPPTGAAQQTSHIGDCKDNSGTWSLPRTNVNVSGEFGCLLINEEGHLQDPSIIYPDHEDSDSQHTVREQSNHNENMALDSTENMFGESNVNISHVMEMLHQQSMGKGGRRHACNMCSATFYDSTSLKAHRQTHKEFDEGLSYLCNQRRKTFTRTCNLKAQGPHLCSHCAKVFPSISELQKHKCAQTGDKPYCCAVCGNKFSRLWNLKLHQRIHTQEKPHHCGMCNKSFTRADILKVHQRTHTGERPYCCLVCGLSFKRLDHLKSHQRKHVTDQ